MKETNFPSILRFLKLTKDLKCSDPEFIWQKPKLKEGKKE